MDKRYPAMANRSSSHMIVVTGILGLIYRKRGKLFLLGLLRSN